MQEKITALIEQVTMQLYSQKITVDLTRPEAQFGDYSTNVALQLAGKTGKNPHEIAEQIAAELKHESIAKTDVAGPGFINITLSDQALLEGSKQLPTKSLDGKVVVAEYSDPNPFKVLHAGHLYTSVVGDAVANLAENAGANVHRVNFGGDVGLHVAKTMWAILKRLGGENPEKLAEISEEDGPEWLTAAYIEGNNAYEENEALRPEITEINKRVYKVHADNDHDSDFAKIYWECRQWSYKYFDAFYELIGTKFEKYYPESQTAPLGLKTVKEQLQKGVYEESDGAVVFKGEPYGLHTRVFINSEGLPTYEAKDVGLIMAKWADYHFDKSIVITGNDIVEYMKVVIKSVEQFAPELAEATTHLTHGIVKMQGGVKMSSRKGNILRAKDVLFAASDASKAVAGKDDQNVVLGAVKYAFLKQRIGGDIIYDPNESVSLEGNSGPYLQYAHARARSILKKSSGGHSLPSNLEEGERTLVRKLSMFAEVVDQATGELMPHYICTYLYELAQEFNRFYEGNRVIGDPREGERLGLVKQYADTLKKGFSLLGIHAPETM